MEREFEISVKNQNYPDQNFENSENGDATVTRSLKKQTTQKQKESDYNNSKMK